MQQQAKGFSVEEAITERIVSNSNSDKCKVNDKVNKNHLLQNVRLLQLSNSMDYKVRTTNGQSNPE